MVAITILSVIVGLLLLDILVQYVEAKLSHPAVPPGPLPDLPLGLFFHPNHCWARLEQNGVWRVGLDALIGQMVGRIESVSLLVPGTHLRAGDPLATVILGNKKLVLRSPVGGEITEANPALGADSLADSPYTEGWMCVIRPESLSDDTRRLAVGEEAMVWQRHEAGRLADFFGTIPALTQVSAKISETGLLGLAAAIQKLDESESRRFQKAFLDAAG